jgi:hypothetical protein
MILKAGEFKTSEYRMADYRTYNYHYGEDALNNQQQARANGLHAATAFLAKRLANETQVMKLAEIFATYIITGEMEER